MLCNIRRAPAGGRLWCRLRALTTRARLLGAENLPGRTRSARSDGLELRGGPQVVGKDGAWLERLVACRERDWRCAFDTNEALASRIRSVRMDAQQEFANRTINRTESSSQSSIVVMHDMGTVAEVVHLTQAIRRPQLL
jgi:hypothetical protein